MKCIAIDDEPIALSIISQFCQRMEDVELSTYSDPLKGMEQVRKRRPDILFLDIEMGGFNGVELARELPRGVLLIFTTAYAQFALDGFELNAIDYLHKPFSFGRFTKAVEKAKQLIQLQTLSQEPLLTEEEITVKVEYRSVKIRLAEIIYIEAMDNYVRIHVNNSRPILSKMSMKSILELLPMDIFMRVHKSFIVPTHRIASYTRMQLILHYKSTAIPIGRTYADGFLEQVKNNRI